MNQSPLFSKGRILKQESLEHLRDYPREVVELLFGDFTDGILSGFRIRYEKETVYVGKGMLRHGRTCYMLLSEVGLPCRRYGSECVVRFAALPPGGTADFQEYPFQIELGAYRKPALGEYELGRFWLEEGAYLRVCKDYRDFQDAFTQVNTLRVIGRIHAGRDQSTLSPALLRLFGRELLQAKGRTSLDEAFSMVCLNQERVERETIMSYLSASGRLVSAADDNEGLCLHLLEIWRRRRGETAAQGWLGGKGSRKTLIE